MCMHVEIKDQTNKKKKNFREVVATLMMNNKLNNSLWIRIKTKNVKLNN